MKKINPLICYFAIAAFCALGFNVRATTTNAPSTYANISIDGSFDDWASVPLAYAQPQIAGNRVQYDSLYVANDADYLYIYFTLYTSAFPFSSSENLFVDMDTNYNTGNHEHGIGSDLVIQGGNGYQENSGVFNAGAVSGLNYLMASNSLGTDYELRLSLDVLGTNGLPMLTGNTISIYLESGSEAGSGGNEWFPNYSSSAEAGLLYTLAAAPVPEPSVFALLACGGAFTAMVFMRRRQSYLRSGRRFSKTI